LKSATSCSKCRTLRKATMTRAVSAASSTAPLPLGSLATLSPSSSLLCRSRPCC
ncbi:MAG: hypothetical protein MHM6MM_008514, partial [Cercozoa sp. M6MM]